MRSIFIAMVVMFFFVSCDFQAADHLVIDENGNEKIEDGYLGGTCLKGDVCIEKEAECVKGNCIEKETEVSDDVEISDDENVIKEEENECFGMKGSYKVLPAKIVIFGTKNYQRDLVPDRDTLPKDGIYTITAGENGCSMIAYNAADGIIEPVNCQGKVQVSIGQYENCTYAGALDLVDGSKGCDWNCVDYK